MFAMYNFQNWQNDLQLTTWTHYTSNTCTHSSDGVVTKLSAKNWKMLYLKSDIIFTEKLEFFQLCWTLCFDTDKLWKCMK